MITDQVLSRIPLLSKLQNGLIVSCQALEGEPLYGPGIMAKMALAAYQGGAVGIRCNGIADIQEIKREIPLPTIGIIKRNYQGFEPYITPTIEEVDALFHSGSDIIAVDATDRLHPGGQYGPDYVREIKKRYPLQVLMADISTWEEGIRAEEAGVDILSTTLSGYTKYSPQTEEPDFELISQLAKRVRIPLFAEGRLNSPEKAKLAFDAGADAIIIGSAITRPQLITEHYIKAIKRRRIVDDTNG